METINQNNLNKVSLKVIKEITHTLQVFYFRIFQQFFNI